MASPGPAKPSPDQRASWKPLVEGPTSAPLNSPAPPFGLQQTAGNQSAAMALAAAADLARIRTATEQVALRLGKSKGRRQMQQEINDDQWATSTVSEGVGSLVSNAKRLWRGDELKSVTLPTESLWEESERLLSATRREIANRDVVQAARALGEFAEAYGRAESTFNEYLETVIEGSEISTAGLEWAKVAGAIAATVATGGVAGGAAVPMLGITAGTGLGLLGTSAAVGVGAGTYGVLQEEYSQVGEAIAGTRTELDLGAIARRGGKDAILGFVGVLTGGFLAKWAVGYFGRLALARMTPDQIAMVAEKLGLEAAYLTPQAFLSRGQQFLIDFLAGTATTPLTAAVEAVLQQFEGKDLPPQEVFGKMVMDNAIQGGLLQLFLAAITHRSAPKPSPKRAPIPLPDAPMEMNSQTTSEATLDLHTSTSPKAETPALTDVPPESWLQSAQESLADIQSQVETSRNAGADSQAVGGATEPSVPLETVQQSMATLQQEVGVPKPGLGQPQIDPAENGPAKEFRKAKSGKLSAKPRKAELEQTGQATQKPVAAGEMIRQGKATPTVAERVKQRGKQRGILREEQMHDVHDWKDRRGKADKLRRETRLLQAESGLKVGDPDPAFPGLKIKALHEDHIVPAREIRKLEGFAQLDEAAQLQLLNAPENLELVSDLVNLSRGDKPYGEWTGHEELGLKADPSWLAEMVEKENQLRQLLQARVSQLLRSQINRAHWLRLGMPEASQP